MEAPEEDEARPETREQSSWNRLSGTAQEGVLGNGEEEVGAQDHWLLYNT